MLPTELFGETLQPRCVRKSFSEYKKCSGCTLRKLKFSGDGLAEGPLLARREREVKGGGFIEIGQPTYPLCHICSDIERETGYVTIVSRAYLHIGAGTLELFNLRMQV